MINKQYIGDGVYAEFDDERAAVVLTTENGIEVTNIIVIDANVWGALKDYVKLLFR